MVIPVASIARWLPEIFPEGTANRNYLVREMAAKTIFVMLYIDAVDGTGRWLRPDQVTKMTDRQAARTDSVSREKWIKDSVAPGKMRSIAGRWYAANTREPIRDETLRSGLIAVGAVIERVDLPTTSSKPRYALAGDFVELLTGLEHAPENAGTLIVGWQRDHLTTEARSRIDLMRRGAVQRSSGERVRVNFPNGEVRLMYPGPSTTITKAVVEGFAPRFLREPAVIFLSESGNKVVARDEEIAVSMGLRLDFSRNLPDIILADVTAQAHKLVFVEVVATDGVVTSQRKQSLEKVARDAGFNRENIYFVSAFQDRTAPAFRKLAAEIAWGTFAWFVSEPDMVLAFRTRRTAELPTLFQH